MDGGANLQPASAKGGGESVRVGSSSSGGAADDRTCFELAHGKLDKLLVRINTLGIDHVAELLFKGRDGDTSLHFALQNDASEELLVAICKVMKGDPQKRNLFSIPNDYNQFPLHYCVSETTNLKVLQQVIDKCPDVLIKEDWTGYTPLYWAKNYCKQRSNHAEIVRCVEENTQGYPSLLNQTTVKLCLVAMKKNGMTEEVAALSMNELSRPQFVFFVLDEMVNREMRLMADNVLSYVGTSGT